MTLKAIDVFDLPPSFGIGAACILLVLAAFLAPAWDLTLLGKQTEGQVIRFIKRTDRHGKAYTLPDVRFSVDGKTYTFIDNMPLDPAKLNDGKFREGSSAIVSYLPDQPARARLYYGVQHWIAPGMLSFLALVFLGYAWKKLHYARLSETL